MLTGVLVARLDRTGDVLLTGPLVRACATRSERVVFMASRDGAAAARLLPGVNDVVTVEAPWISADPGPITRGAVDRVVAAAAGAGVSRAVISTSFHQSPLPLALLLRLAGMEEVGATSEDYPGSLLDVRHRIEDDVHEVERSLSLGRAMGFDLAAGDDGRLGVHGLPPAARLPLHPAAGYVVVHPGASVPARTWAPHGYRGLVRALHAEWVPVVVTGSASEKALTAFVAGDRATDAGGRLDLGGLGTLLAGARALVVGNTGPAHLAAAVGTPVVSIYPPTVPAVRWHPWMVPHVILGDQTIGCAGCRARVCPFGHRCLERVTPERVLAALDELGAVDQPRAAARPSRTAPQVTPGGGPA